MAKRPRKERQPRPESSKSEKFGSTIASRALAGTLFLFGVIPLANLTTNGVGLPWWNQTMLDWLVWGGSLVALALLLGRFAAERIESVAAAATRVLVRIPSPIFALVAAQVATFASLYFGWKIVALQAVAGDEFAQGFEAAILRSGHLAALAPHPVEFFSTTETLMLNGRWLSQFPVGGPVLLALGDVLRAPWIVNPLLTGLAVVAIYYFVRAIHDEVMARVTALLAIVSPFIVFMGGSRMNHTPTLLLMWGALALLASRDRLPARAQLLATVGIGLCVGVGATIRPFDAFVCAVIIGAFQLVTQRDRQNFWRDVVIQTVAAAGPVVLLLWVNQHTLGAPLPFAYDVLNGPEHRPGFHATPLGFDHTPRRGLYMASAYLMKLDVALFAWPVPGLLVIVATLLLMRSTTKWDRLMAALVVVFLCGYAAYWAESYFMGPRFLFLLAPVFVYYTARLPTEIRVRVKSPTVAAAALVALPLLAIAAWLMPATHGVQFGVRELASQLYMRSPASAIAAEVSSRHLRNAVVFIPESWRDRLAARLRAAGFRPLSAERILAEYDACALQRALDTGEQSGLTSSKLAGYVFNAAVLDRRSAQLAPVKTRALVALVPGRQLTPECLVEINRSPPVLVTLAELLPFATLDASGALAGDVIYARDLGERNRALLPQYGARAWYFARTDLIDGTIRVSLVQLR